MMLKKEYHNKNKFNNIYFNVDMTEAERNLMYQLRTQAKVLNASNDNVSLTYFGIRDK